jgi:hypothetical protein
MIPAPAPPAAPAGTVGTLASAPRHRVAIAAERAGNPRISIQMLMQIKPIVTPVVTPGKAPA